MYIFQAAANWGVQKKACIPHIHIACLPSSPHGALSPTAPPLPSIHTPAMSANYFCNAGPPPPYSYLSPPPLQSQGPVAYLVSPSSASPYFQTPLEQNLCFHKQQPLYLQGGGDACGYCGQQQQQFVQEQLRFAQNQFLNHQQAQQQHQLQLQLQHNPQPQLCPHLQYGTGGEYGTSGRDGMNSSLAAGAAGVLWGSSLGLGKTGMAAVRYPPLRRGRGEEEDKADDNGRIGRHVGGRDL